MIREKPTRQTQTGSPAGAVVPGGPHGFAFGWAALVYAACTLSLGYPALFGKFLVGPHSDQYIAGFAFRDFAAQTLRTTGHFPLWNPYLFGGMPYVAAMHGDIFYPTFLLRMIMPTDVAMTWGFAIHLFLAGCFAYGFLRTIGYGFFGALAGGVAYMMGGQLASLVSPGHDGKLFVSALFPLALWLLHIGVRRGKLWAWGALAIVTGLAVLSPHPQLLQYMLLCSGAYALFLVFSSVDGARLPRAIALRRLGLALASVATGLAIGAIQYLPVREYVPWSPRAGGLAGYDVATSYAWPPEELLNVYLPQFSGMLDAYWGRNGIHLHSDYVGVVVLLLAGAALTGMRTDPRRKQLIFWGSALLISLLWALGGHTPFYHIPYALVPGTKFFRAPAAVFFIGALAISVMSASGIEKLLERRVGKRYLFGWLGAAAAIAILASLGGVTGIAVSLGSDAPFEKIQNNSGAVIVGAWRSFLFVAVTVAIALAYFNSKITSRAAAWALVAVMATDLWTIESRYWIFSEPASRLFAADPVIAAIRADPQPSRVLEFQLKQGSGIDPFLSGDALMSHGVRTVLGYHGNQIGRYDRLLDRERDYAQITNPNVWKLLNARYLLTNSPEVGFIPDLKLADGPVRNASGDSVYLFRLNGDNPYAWVTPVAVKAGDDQVLATILDKRFEINRAALFDTASSVKAVTGLTQLPEPLAISVSVRSYAPGSAKIALSAPAPRGASLIVSENYYPGWRATVDGKPATVGRADFTLIGVELPEGAREIELSFGSAAYETGKLITLAALMLAAAAAVIGAVVERRQRA